MVVQTKNLVARETLISGVLYVRDAATCISKYKNIKD